MNSISNAQHQAFCKAVLKELSQTVDSAALMDRKIEECLQHMERLQTDYMQHLRALQALVIRYESAVKETRTLLRKRRVVQKQQAIAKTKSIHKMISKAS